MLSRRYVERRQEKKAFWNPANGKLFIEGAGLLTSNHATLADAIHATISYEVDVLYLMPCRGRWIDQRGQYPGKKDWESSGLHLDAYFRNHAAVVGLEAGKGLVDIVPIGLWFPSYQEGMYMSDVIKAMRILQELLTKHFQPIEVTKGKHEEYRVEILTTPARTGMDLLRRKLPYGVKYEDLPEAVEHILMSNFGQARFELFGHGDDTIERIFNYDGLWMYASCCRHMPIGRVIHDNVDKYEKYVSGFYLVAAQIPDDWAHIGILPVKNPDMRKQGSIFPNHPGTTISSWASHNQVRLALNHGWKITILERILWPDTQARGIKGQDPLRHWMETLVKLRQELVADHKEPIRSFLRDAFRNLLNMSIGCMYRTGKDKDIYLDDFWGDEETPEGALLIDVDDVTGVRHYQKREALTRYQREGFKPHWAITVWKEAEYKVTKAALAIPYEDLVAIRADGIWTCKPANLENTGKPGCFREKELVYQGPFKWPKNDQGIKNLIRKARGE